jgi:HAD superfamily hydrolase (TIGR01490 family)
LKRIAFFDFDGTITTRDTLLELIRFHSGNTGFYWGFLLYSPWLIAFKLGIISNQLAKEKVIGHFFRKMDVGAFDKLCEAFCSERLPLLIRKKALNEIELLKSKGAEVVVVSASPENWVGRWCQSNAIECLATRLVNKDGRLTGRIAGRNCHGDEKVTRVKEIFRLDEYNEILCYGDTKGDKPLLQLATIAFYKPFR